MPFITSHTIAMFLLFLSFTFRLSLRRYRQHLSSLSLSLRILFSLKPCSLSSHCLARIGQRPFALHIQIYTHSHT